VASGFEVMDPGQFLNNIHFTYKASRKLRNEARIIAAALVRSARWLHRKHTNPEPARIRIT
jgi:hypothetical protein